MKMWNSKMILMQHGINLKQWMRCGTTIQDMFFNIILSKRLLIMGQQLIPFTRLKTLKYL